jgi:hypothetical protein
VRELIRTFALILLLAAALGIIVWTHQASETNLRTELPAATERP